MRTRFRANLFFGILPVWGVGFAAQAAEPAWFWPGEGPEVAVWSPPGLVGEVPVERTGWVLLMAEDPERFLQDPEVVAAEPQRGDPRVLRLQAKPGVDEIALSRRLRQEDGVYWSHPDFAFHLVPLDRPDDPYFEDQWHLENTGQGGGTVGADIRALDAWALTRGEGVRVAIVDSGVDTDHPDMIVIPGYDYVDGDEDPDPEVSDDNHGTAVAGLTAALGNNGLGVSGVAQGAEVYAIRLIGGGTTLSDIRNAWIEATDAGSVVINNSWGSYSGCAASPTYGAVANGLDHAETEGRGGLGTVVVFASGNEGCDASEDGTLVVETVIGVAAIDRNDQRESYSNTGTVVDISAYAGGTVTTDMVGSAGYSALHGDDSYTPDMSGTSSASPVVAGVVALMIAANPNLSAAEVREVLRWTSARIQVDSASYDGDGWSTEYGYGRVDAGAAVGAVYNTAPTEPVPTGPDADPPADRVILQWNVATDAEDPVNHRIRLEVDGASEELSAGAGDHLDLGSVTLTNPLSSGASVRWWIWAEDPWTRSAEVEGPAFVVGLAEVSSREAAEVELVPVNTSTGPGEGAAPRSGCGLVAAGPWWLGLGLVLAQSRRSKRQVMPSAP